MLNDGLLNKAGRRRIRDSYTLMNLEESLLVSEMEKDQYHCYYHLDAEAHDEFNNISTRGSKKAIRRRVKSWMIRSRVKTKVCRSREREYQTVH